MNALARTNTQHDMVTAKQAEDMRTVLKNSLYPGASDASVDLVLAYCRASNLDPMTKPVHIVPMTVSTGRKDDRGYDIKERRDVVMPGVGLYRTNAARTGQYAGCSEPEFGPTKTLDFKAERWEDGPNNKRVKRYVDDSIEYPEWCRVTVRKLLGNTIVEFTAVEYWRENYATKGDDDAPNAMWEKRPFAQLAKCAEAQALRKAFPEAVGSQPTAEEMEGKSLVIEGDLTGKPGSVAMPTERQLSSPAPAENHAPSDPTPEGTRSAHVDEGPGIFGLTESQMRILRKKAEAAGLAHDDGVDAALVDKFDRIDASNINTILQQLRPAE